MEAQSLSSHQHSWWFSCFSLREKLARSHNRKSDRAVTSSVLVFQTKRGIKIGFGLFTATWTFLVTIVSIFNDFLHIIHHWKAWVSW